MAFAEAHMARGRVGEAGMKLGSVCGSGLVCAEARRSDQPGFLGEPEKKALGENHAAGLRRNRSDGRNRSAELDRDRSLHGIACVRAPPVAIFRHSDVC